MSGRHFHLAPCVGIASICTSCVSFPRLTCCRNGTTASLNLKCVTHNTDSRAGTLTCVAAQSPLIVHPCAVDLMVSCQCQGVHPSSSYLQSLYRTHRHVSSLGTRYWRRADAGIGTKKSTYLLPTCHSGRRSWGLHNVFTESELATIPIANDKKVARHL